MPWLSEASWNSVSDNIEEAERLEFLGDGAIGDSVGDIVVKLYPEGTPHGYTQIKSVLTCNAFFAQLMYKLGISQDESTKQAADAFEVIIGLFKKEKGTQGVEDWAWQNFSPLAEAAWDIYEEIKGQPRKHRNLLSHQDIQNRRRYLVAHAAPQGPPGSGTSSDPYIIE